MTKTTLLTLRERAAKLRLHILEEVYTAQSGHPGGSLSAADILTYLYFDAMQVDPAHPDAPERDRFVLSKGHCSPALYAALAMRGFFPEEDLPTFRKLGSYLQGHPDRKGVPGVDMSTGSLGQGISAACGIAAALKRQNNPAHVYALLGDGECEEGQVWEAAMFAAHYKLDNLTAFIDFNHLQIDGDIRTVMNPTPIDAKFAAFGWQVVCIDGHDFNALEDAVHTAKATAGKPTAIICTTVKGKGVSYMENQAGWHGKAPKGEQYEQGRAELLAAWEKAKEELNHG